MTLQTEIQRVVQNGNCTGCGGCEWLFPGVEMKLNEEGFLRPALQPGQPEPPEAAASFRRMCPGVGVRVHPEADTKRDSVFGAYVSAWEARAIDPALRRRGSSAGVLSALSDWLRRDGTNRKIVASSGSTERPSRSVPIQLMTRADVEAAATSRYAPVANIPALGSASANDVLVGKPCEAAAVRQHFEGADDPPGQQPLLLSFFCAGTPSQQGTDALIAGLGVEEEQVTSLKYRGDGWPGRFTVTDTAGRTESMSYPESWGGTLGKQLQTRCKLCAHGTGDSADVAVGDFWVGDADGYPKFDEAEGNSIVLARTRRGHDLLIKAKNEGIVELSAIDLNEAKRMQPLQRRRGATLAGRLLGRALAGFAVPNYQGFGLIAQTRRMPASALKAIVGTWRRAMVDRRQQARTDLSERQRSV
ncbi:Coenzyme F420 hydrogenase/dehydrogenase, beta subunit C-terminal domain [Curtobacterium sp. MCPF17_050]|uniref:Coenzyme F420 hydrogenase/dehydrogenase, beta subunit C-terminal domain n=1 Tax=Curtobacterium sp. MCPF17_050 TaxID=2175664 RepID=UPI000D86495F|nr:Coenzyme F420 hydrogenase/dehydrogenase, beta subunit C-terminal domain [Curtobacterium sp. MCPF17_050]WIB16061.1 Coenzyme F420 hydrogenase/dehydrogenase, beta subunit C-terminal domain [Curtobacterium sp. MCPF17_050]